MFLCSFRQSFLKNQKHRNIPSDELVFWTKMQTRKKYVETANHLCWSPYISLILLLIIWRFINSCVSYALGSQRFHTIFSFCTGDITIKNSEIETKARYAVDNKPHLKVGQKPEEIRISKKLKKIKQL